MKHLKTPRKLKKVANKVSCEVGLAGQGDKMLKSKFGKLTWREKQRYNREMKALADVRQQSFRQACIEVLGEDPETDWV